MPEILDLFSASVQPLKVANYSHNFAFYGYKNNQCASVH